MALCCWVFWFAYSEEASAQNYVFSVIFGPYYHAFVCQSNGATYGDFQHNDAKRPDIVSPGAIFIFFLEALLTPNIVLQHKLVDFWWTVFWIFWLNFSNLTYFKWISKVFNFNISHINVLQHRQQIGWSQISMDEFKMCEELQKFRNLPNHLRQHESVSPQAFIEVLVLNSRVFFIIFIYLNSFNFKHLVF